MTLEEMKKDVRFWQRLLRLAGYYKGGIDGIRGPLQRAAEEAWYNAACAGSNKYGTFDSRTEGNLQTIIPEAQTATRAWLAGKVLPWAKAQGYKVQIIQGTRSYAEQDALYAQGRTKKGKIVTKAKGGHSNHNFGVAFDVGIFKLSDGEYQTTDAPYRALYKACGAPQGMEWGGNWKSIGDTPHYQLSKWGSNADAIRAVF